MHETKIDTLTWIDLHQPQKAEVVRLMERFTIDPTIAEDLLTPTPKPKCVVFENCVYSVFHFPAFRQSHTSHSQEMDLVIGKDFIITAHFDAIESLELFKKKVQVELASRANNTKTPLTTLDIGARLLHELYASALSELESADEEIQKIEGQIFEGKEKDTVILVSKLHRTLINFKKIIIPHKEVLYNLKNAAGLLFPTVNNSLIMDTLIADYYRVRNTLTGNAEMLDELRLTNDSLVSTKQNRIMTTFTILAFVTLPLSLIANIFGMNAIHMPIIGMQYDFYILLAVMFTLTLSMYFYFRMRDWL